MGNDLLTVPSRLFYASELLASAEVQRRNAFIGAPFLPNKNCPLVVVNVEHGEECKELHGTSWFNAAEMLQVIRYAQLVLNHLSLKNPETKTVVSADDVIEDI